MTSAWEEGGSEGWRGKQGQTVRWQRGSQQGFWIRTASAASPECLNSEIHEAAAACFSSSSLIFSLIPKHVSELMKQFYY